MPRLNLPATKINLIRLREELKLAQEGYELLEQKRQVLIMEVMHLIDDLRKERADVERLLKAAYAKLLFAEVGAGDTIIERAGLSAASGMDLDVRERSVMGIIIPVVDTTEAEFRPSYSLLDSTSAVDEAAAKFHEALRHIAKLGELENAALKLATELKKTQRRVNALSTFFIPQYQETVKFLQETLEERERDALFALKRLKARAEEAA